MIVKRIQIQILKRAYIAYNDMLKSHNQQTIKFVVLSKAFRSSENQDLRKQLKAIQTAEKKSHKSHALKSINCQNAIKGNFMKIFHTDFIPSFKSRNVEPL